jgi:hypothetical protein
MLGQSIGLPESQHQLARKAAHECFAKFSSKELMDALMAADLPMGGLDVQRIERLLSVGHPQDVLQFFHRDALQRVSHTLGQPII